MKKEFIKKYGGFIIAAVLIILCFKMIDNISVLFGWANKLIFILRPVIWGTVIAYFLNPLVVILEKKFSLSKHTFLKKQSRLYGVLIVFLLFLVLIIAMIAFLVPGIIQTSVEFTKQIPTYASSFEKMVKTNITNPDMLRFVMNFEEQITSLIQNIANIKPNTYIDTAITATNTLYTILMSMIFCPYILFEKDKLITIIERILTLFIQEEIVKDIKEYATKINYIVGKFIYGKFLDSVIIGFIALIGFGIMKLPYFPILALVILVTNMIPYFGPFIGGIPVAFIVLLTQGFMPALTVAIFIFILQQFDGLILGPAILGDVIGISPFWILFSITFFGEIFGVVGMFLGVPFICIIRMFFHDLLEYKKKQKA